MVKIHIIYYNMNLLLLPKELQDLISEFNVEHRPKMRVILNELLLTHNERMDISNYCENCGCDSDEIYSTYIFWHKYTFCGDWCRYDTESSIRKNYKITQQRYTPLKI